MEFTKVLDINFFLILKHLSVFKFRYNKAAFSRKIKTYSIKLVKEINNLNNLITREKPIKKKSHNPKEFRTIAMHVLKKQKLTCDIKFDSLMYLRKKTPFTYFLKFDIDRTLIGFSEIELNAIKKFLKNIKNNKK